MYQFNNQTYKYTNQQIYLLKYKIFVIFLRLEFKL